MNFAPDEREFHQAVRGVYADILDEANRDERIVRDRILERLLEPDRTISFRVTWEDDNQQVHVNRGYRLQHCNAIGPYKGGLRFDPSVNLSVLKFLAFEQTFKNALTGLPLGGGKGGSDFDPSGRSEREICRFCSAFMTELHRHIGPDTDVPAGDINVGSREIGYLFGAYRRITNEFEGALTGKGESYGGSALRAEATGYGLLHFVCHMLDHVGDSIDGKTTIISGAGNVATHAAEKAVMMGANVVTLSDRKGFVHDPEGMTLEKIQWVKSHKATPGNSLKDYTQAFGGHWYAGKSPWLIECDIALPCATQNEMDEKAVRRLLHNGCILIAEGANMPLTQSATEAMRASNALYAPSKAANAGGVAVSGLEISANRTALSRTRNDLSQDLHSIMKSIHDRCVEAGTSASSASQVDYVRGANIAAFKRLSRALMAQGIT